MQYKKPRKKRSVRSEIKDYFAIGRELERAALSAKIDEMQKKPYTRIDPGTGREHPLSDEDWPDNGRCDKFGPATRNDEEGTNGTHTDSAGDATAHDAAGPKKDSR